MSSFRQTSAPDSSLTVFSFADNDYFGILQSGIHWPWFTAKCSTLTERFRYTSDTVFDTFAWPQFDVARSPRRRFGRRSPSPLKPFRATIRRDARSTRRRDGDATKNPRRGRGRPRVPHLRHEIMDANGWSLRELYKSLETPGENRLRTAHAALDAAVRAAYGMKPDEDILAFLLKLNLELAEKEAKGETITPPGLPAFVPKPDSFVSRDCVRSPDDPEADGSTTQIAQADAAHFYFMAKEKATPYRTK